SIISWFSSLKFEARIRRIDGSSSMTSILPIAGFHPRRIVNTRCGNLQRKTNLSRPIDFKYQVTMMRARDVTGNRETEASSGRLGCKEWLKNAFCRSWLDRPHRVDNAECDNAALRFSP